ncbi:MAG: c-type cytochrome [Gammaproteobacteria bacterium]|nr:c-type cytochrome [Gammaproteobacteria bacterium]
MSLTKRQFVWRVSLLLLLLWQPLLGREYDPDNGEEINEVCAGCHGEYGQGGNEGEYPRLAAQPAEFMVKQLYLFRDRKRPNIAMIEYVDDRQMPEDDIRDVSVYLAGIKLKTRLPPVDETAPDFDAYGRLLESKRLMQIPLAEGDVERGRKLYGEECASCHGKQGWGSHKKDTPMLAGQYTQYLWRQVKKLRKRLRIHEEDEPEQELLDEVKDSDLKDIFAYLSTVDD